MTRRTNLEILGSQVRVTGPPLPPSVEQRLIEMCRYRPTGASFSEAFRTGECNGYIELFRYGRFPVGLLVRVQMALALMGQEVHVTDYRPHVDPNPISPLIPLRDYQEGPVEAILTRDRGLTQAPTGAGKTIMFLHLLCRLGLPAIVVVNTMELVDQTLDKMEAVGGRPGLHATSDIIKRWAAGEMPALHNPPWVVCTWQTLHSLIRQSKRQAKPSRHREVAVNDEETELHREALAAVVDQVGDAIGSKRAAKRLAKDLGQAEKPEALTRLETDEELRQRVRGWKAAEAARRASRAELKRWCAQFQVVIADEAHIAGAECVSEVMAWLPARRRYGFSATPWRPNNDDIRMFGAVGDTAPGITASELIRQGHLVRPVIKFLNLERLDPRVKVTISDYGRWDVVMAEGVVDNDARNQVLVDKALGLVEQERVTLLMCKFRRHGERLETLLREAGIHEARFVHGNMSAGTRRDFTTRFRQGRVRAAVSSSVWDTGLDVPVLSGGVFVGPYKSNTANIQRGGRFLRTYTGPVPAYGLTNWVKQDARIYDTWDPFPYLRNWQTDRFELWKLEEEFEVIP